MSKNVKNYFKNNVVFTCLLCLGSMLFCVTPLDAADYCYVNPVEESQWEIPDYIYAAVQDKRGVIWFGTSSGLYKFDGHHYIKVKNSRHSIVNMVLTHDNRLLIATWTSSAILFDINSENFTELSDHVSTRYDVVSADNDQYWMGGSDGLFKYNSQYEVIEHLENVSARFIKSIDQEIFFSDIKQGNKKGLYVKKEASAELLSTKPIKKLFASKMHHLIWNRNSKNTQAYSTKEKEWKTYFDKIGLWSLIDNNDGTVWMSNYDEKLRHYDFVSNRIINQIDVTQLIGVNHKGSKNFKILLKDTNDTIWLYNDKQLLQFVCTDAIKLIEPSVLKRNGIRAVRQGKKQDIWFGGNKGLIRYTSDKRFEKIPGPSKDVFDADGSYYVSDFLVGRNNRLWVITESGLYRLQLDNFHWQRIEALVTDDRRIGDIAFWGEKIIFFDLEITIIDRKTLDSYVLPISRENHILNNRAVNNVVQVEKGEFIISSSIGAWLVDIEGNTYTDLGVIKMSKSLADNMVFSSLMASNGDIWSAQRSGGIVQVSGGAANNMKYRFLGAEDGLSKGRNVSIIEGPEKNIWVASKDGLYKIEPSSHSIRRFGRADGIPIRVFHGAESLLAKNKKLYFGGRSLVVEVDAEKLNSQRILTQPIFSQLKVNGEKISAKRLTSNLNLSFKPTQNNLTFVFGSSNFRYVQKTEFAVKLKPQDDWLKIGNTSSIDYLDLAPGDYQFQIKSRSEHGPWSSPLNAVNFSIDFPFWQTWWAITLYGILGLVLLYFMQVYREKKLKEQARNLASQVKERTIKIATLLDKKNDLFAHVSHEIRTPLTLIRGPVKQLLTTAKETSQKIKLNTALTNTNRLIKMVDQLLTLAKMNTPDFENKQVYNVAKVLDFVCQSILSLADKKNIELIWKTDDALFVEMTSNSLETILVNLCVNALKYSPPDSKVEVLAFSSNLANSMVIQVSDQGPGIDSENQKKIFERFTRVNPTQDGIGLGLAIVKELIEKHQGQIEIDASYKNGSRFVVHLPSTQVESSAQFETENSQFFDIETATSTALTAEVTLMDSGKTELKGDEESIEARISEKMDAKANVLIIDDTREMAEYLRNLLSDDYHCEVAYDGEEGMQIAKSNCPDLILSDVMMPKLDGFGVVEQIRNNMATSHIPVVLLTAIGDDNSKLKAYQQNADDYITKPFLDEELKLRIQSILEIRKLTVLGAIKNRAGLYFRGPDRSIESSNRENQFLEKLNETIEAHYSQSSFGVTELANCLHLTERTLLRKTRALTEMSPIHFLRSYRIEKAINLILQSDESITSIVEQAGFSNRQRFYRYFKAYTGMTPAEYKEKCKT